MRRMNEVAHVEQVRLVSLKVDEGFVAIHFVGVVRVILKFNENFSLLKVDGVEMPEMQIGNKV